MPMFRASSVLLLALIATAVPAQHARADSGSIGFGILNLESIDVPPELGIAVTDVLRRQLGQLSGAQVSAQDMVEVKLVFGCVDEKPGCLARAGRQFGVRSLIYGKVRPQPGDNAAVVVTLHQLHVGTGAVENSLEEAVPSRVLSDGNAELDSLVQRWLLRLAAPVHERRDRPRAPSASMRWNRGLWISAALFGTLAGAAALAALGTSRGIGEAQDGAGAHLDLLQSRLTKSGTIEAYRGFFESSEQLSHCATVAALIGDPDYEGYRGVCQRGNALATASTGLLAAAGGLAFLSVTSLILSRVLRKSEPASRPVRPSAVSPPAPTQPRRAPAVPASPSIPDPAEVPAEGPPAGDPRPGSQSLTGVRLDAIAATIDPSGAAVMMQLRF